MKRTLALLLALLLLGGCAKQEPPPSQSGPEEQPSQSGPEHPPSQSDPEHPHASLRYKYSADFFDVFDTYTTVVGYAGSQEEFDSYVELIHGEMLRLHRLYDIYSDYPGITNLKTVNDSAGLAPVAVDAAIIDLLELAERAYEETGGAVNVAMGPVLRVWHEYREAGLADPEGARLPDMAELRAAAEHMAIENLIVDREAGTVLLREAGMSLDVGALAKGYAAQLAADRAREAGFTSFVLSAGGNVCAVGTPADGRDSWSVGIQSPDSAQDLLDTVYISDMSVVSSGDYQRYYTVEEVDYHHIIDPETLLPARRARAVTVLHPDSGQADLLSTAAYILPLEEAMALVEAHSAEGIWLLPDGSMRATEGYRAVSQMFGAD